MKLQTILEQQYHSIESAHGKCPRDMNRLNVSYSDVESFKGGPDIILGELNLVHNKFVYFDEHAPKEVGTLRAQYNRFLSLENMPIVRDDIIIHDCALTSLKGAPKIANSDFNVGCNELHTLEFAPERVNGDFACEYNHLTSLEHVPGEINGNFYCSYNQLTSLKGIHKQIKKMKGKADFTYNKLTSHMLGVLKIEGLTHLEAYGKNNEDRPDIKATEIINKHLKGARNIFDCQAELEDAGLEEFAQL